jgi:hypothetical protein
VARPTFSIDIELDAQGKRTLQMVQQLPKRLTFLRKWVPYLMAKETLEAVLDNLPTSKETKTYRDSLRVVRVAGGDEYAIQADMTHAGVEEVDTARTVVYVRVRKRRMAGAPPQIAILQKYSPWTLDTIPFVPSQKEARVVSRKVGAAEVKAVAEQRREDEQKWRAELARVGSKTSKKNKLPLPKTPGHPIPDVAFQAIRQEFGLGGVKAQPHWRPAIRETVTRVTRTLQRRPAVVRLLTQPGASDWSRWIPRLPIIRPAETRKFVGFQDRLKIRFAGV